MSANFYRGWHQIAFERELKETLTPIELGPLSLVLVHDQNRLQAVDAICPHRGAHLAYGGRLDGGAIICPFHGHRIGMGEAGGCPYAVGRYRTLTAGGWFSFCSTNATKTDSPR